MISEIEQYKTNLYIYFNALGGLTTSGFAVLQLLRGDYATGIISSMGFVYFSIIVYTLLIHKKYLWKGRGFVLFIPMVILNVTNLHPEFGIYWAYVGVLSFFLVLELKDACIGVSIFLGAIFYVVSLHFPLPVQLRIYASLFLVAIFSFLLSYFINRLLNQVTVLVTRDSLTHAYNRHTFNSSMKRALYTAIRYKTPASLFIFDLDFFKKVNDNYGHQAGDKVLKIVSSTIQNRLRDSDRLFRYGGEEFAILLNQTNEEVAIKLAEELRLLVESQDYGIDRTVTISGGVSAARASDQVSSWIERCDKALYEAKSSGRNNVILSHPL